MKNIIPFIVGGLLLLFLLHQAGIFNVLTNNAVAVTSQGSKIVSVVEKPICKLDGFKKCILPKPTPQPPFIWMYCRPVNGVYSCVDKSKSYFGYQQMLSIANWQNTYLYPKFKSYNGEYVTFRSVV